MAEWLRTLAAPPEGPGFGSWYPHGSQQPSVILVVADTMSSSGLHRYQVYAWYTGIDKTNIIFKIKI